MTEPKDEAKARGGIARAQSLTAGRRREIAVRAADARWSKGIPSATHSGILKIGDAEIPCYVLENNERILSTRGIMKSLGRRWRGRKYAGTQLPVFLEANNLKPYLPNSLDPVLTPQEFRTPSGVRAEGFRAEILPLICETYLRAREDDALTSGQFTVAKQCEILTRGLSRVGIIALIDEATGFQRDRAADALATILEAFIAKELRPWVRTFPQEFYEQLFRLRGLEFPKDTVKRPQYFGHLTNDIVYRRLAPYVLEQLRNETPRRSDGRLKDALFQCLTQDIGHPKLRELLVSEVTIMKLSDDYDEFVEKLDRIHPRYHETLSLALPPPPKDGGKGL